MRCMPLLLVHCFIVLVYALCAAPTVREATILANADSMADMFQNQYWDLADRYNVKFK